MSSQQTAERLRSTARLFATGIVIVTACNGNELFAKTVSAFQALSMEPPLISVSIGQGSPLIPMIQSSGYFGVSILRREQQELSRHCAIPGNGRMAAPFTAIPLATAATEAPIIADCLGYFDCIFHRIFDGGDHQVVIGRVTMADHTDGHPLLYFDGNYRALDVA